MQANSKNIQTQIEEKVKELDKPGAVFGEPFREGDYTIIPAARVASRGKMLVARPVGAILIGPKGVRLLRFNPPALRLLALLLVAAIIFWSGMLLNPPWKPDTYLLKQVGELVKTIREKEGS